MRASPDSYIYGSQACSLSSISLENALALGLLANNPLAELKDHKPSFEYSDLFDVINCLNIKTIAIRHQTKSIRNLDKFRLVPLSNSFTLPDIEYSDKPGRLRQIPNGITYNYPGDLNGYPYLDSLVVIGLTYDDEYDGETSRPLGHLLAVGGAYIDYNGRLIINQIQNVSNISNPGKRPRKKDYPIEGDFERRKSAYESVKNRYYKSGFQQGLDWKQTLISAWQVSAQMLGHDYIFIQPAEFNFHHKVRENGYNTYNQTAIDMGFDFDFESGLYSRSLI